MLTFTVSANEIKIEEIAEIDSYIENQIIPNTENTPIKIEERSGTSIAIFSGGILVGWVIDGTIKYTTGKAPSNGLLWD